MKTRYKNVTVDPDRHGKLRARFRKAGQKPVYMKTLPDQPGFQAEYDVLAAGVQDVEPRCAPGTIGALLPRFYRSGDFATRGGDERRARRRGILEPFREEFGDDRVSDFTFEHIEAILIAKTQKKINAKGREVGGHVAATNLRKELRRLFRYAKKIGMIAINPVEDAEKIGKDRITGFYTWTEVDIAQYQQRHPIGTKARLALEIILWTGKRRGDARLFGPKHVVSGKVNYKAGKTGADLWLPIARDLRLAIDAMSSVGISTFLITEFGKTFSKDGFGNKMREWCDQAGLPQCTAHGLRKAIARRMAQMRLSDEEMMAVGGWREARQVRTYTEAVDQEELAEGAITRIATRYSVSEDPENV